MALEQCTADVYVIRGLSDTPTETVDELKAAFDGGAQNLKNWINTDFIPELNDTFDTKLNRPESIANGKVIVSSNDEFIESSITTTELNALDGINGNIQEQLNTLQGKITYGTSAPSGGSNGDIYIQYS